jgi:hypothetical protein
VVIKQVFAYLHLFETLPAFNGDHYRPVLVHDVDRAEIPAVDPDGFTMVRRGASLPLVERIGLDELLLGMLRCRVFTMSLGRILGPCGSPVCSLIPTLPAIFRFTCV